MKQISLVARYAEGFKMPTAQQLFTSLPNGGGINSNLIPNPDLRPESVKSYEAGVRVQGSSAFLSVTGFYADYTDFIQNFVQVPSVTNPGFFDFTYQNLSKVSTWGVEIAGEYRFLTHWIVSASIAFIDGTQIAAPNALETAFDGTTPFSGTFGVRYFDPDTGFDGQIVTTWASQALERSSPTLYRPDGYVAFDAIFNWSPRWVPGLTLRGVGAELHRCTLFPFAERRDHLPDRSEHGGAPSPIRSSCRPRPGEPSRSERPIRSDAPTALMPAMDRMHARIRSDAFSEPTIFRIRGVTCHA